MDKRVPVQVFNREICLNVVGYWNSISWNISKSKGLGMNTSGREVSWVGTVFPGSHLVFLTPTFSWIMRKRKKSEAMRIESLGKETLMKPEDKPYLYLVFSYEEYRQVIVFRGEQRLFPSALLFSFNEAPDITSHVWSFAKSKRWLDCVAICLRIHEDTEACGLSVLSCVLQ